MKRILGLIFIFAWLWLSIEFWGIYQSLEEYPNTSGHFILSDRHGTIIADLPWNGGYSLPYTWTLDTPLVKGIIEIEDRRFYSHFGIDILSKLNVVWESLHAGKFTRGGSTITEQYVKNRYFPQAPRTLEEKVREGFWAFAVELRYKKEEILKKYLETVYMGNGIYGIPAALESYFTTDITASLDDDTISETIVRLRYPNLWWSSEEYKNQIAERLWLKIPSWPLPKREKRGYINTFPFLTDRIKKEITLYCNKKTSELHEFVLDIPPDICSGSYIKIISSIDKDASIYASDTLWAILYPLEEKNVHNGAIFVWSEKEKKVLVYIWNRLDATGNGYDMIEKKRSVGSILKPFLYLIALHGHDPNDLILDEKKVYDTEKEWVSYIPENYIPKAYGPVTLKSALGNSLNSAAVRLTEDIGVSRVYASFRSLGFDLDHDASYYGYGIVLWAVELTLENIVSGYSNLTHLDDRENFLLFDILSDKTNRSMTFWESSILNTSLPMAVKTGTSTDFRDNWTVWYNDDIVIGIWVGNTDGSSMNDVSWVTGAWPIYHRVAEDLITRWYTKKKERTFPEWIMTNYLCQDEKCFQKEIAFTRIWYERKSRPASKLYYEKDFITPLTLEEKENWKIR